MSKKIIACDDLGTGGNKASLYDGDGPRAVSSPTTLTRTPAGTSRDPWTGGARWSRARKASRREKADLADIECVSISGHSLGSCPWGGTEGSSGRQRPYGRTPGRKSRRTRFSGRWAKKSGT